MNWNEIFRYEDGNLYWLKPGHKRRLHRPAGYLVPSGYIRTKINGKDYYVHRIVWEMHNCQIPNGFEIDHIDRNRSNNKISNLRIATSQENKRNNKSGGFTWCKRNKVYVAQIKIDLKRKFLGHYDNIIDARAAYLRARREYFGEFA